jgi:hypothetical protein
MFTSITWEIFFTATALIVGSYYGITALLLYHKEIVQWFKSKSQQSLVTTHEREAESTPSVGVMGGINQDNTRAPLKTSVNLEEVAIAASDDEPETIHSPVIQVKDDLLIGSVADLLQEIKTLVQLIAVYKTDKSESQSLFHALLIRYPHLRDTSYQEAIGLYICEAAKGQFYFDVSPKEVSTWWNEERVIIK